MNYYSPFSTPGVSADQSVEFAELFWGSDNSRLLAIYKSGVIDGSTRDVGNTGKTDQLRAGLVLAETSPGVFKEYDPDATNGQQIASAILPHDFKVTDIDNNDTNQNFAVIIGGLIKASKLHGLDLQARRQLASGFCVFDDDQPSPHAALGLPSNDDVLSATRALVAADNGKRFTSNVDGGVYTLPDLAGATIPGFAIEIVNLHANGCSVAAHANDSGSMIAAGDAAADSVDLAAIGDTVRVEWINVNGTAQWVTKATAAEAATP